MTCPAMPRRLCFRITASARAGGVPVALILAERDARSMAGTRFCAVVPRAADDSDAWVATRPIAFAAAAGQENDR